ncbi:MAG: preprotein translocase subunit YajC [Lachnospiraceae bacterium]|jgi:preprotein translocase subunit YajC|nr:preprotein translocase subunit YajC [Lachnospiraceae bacterium]
MSFIMTAGNAAAAQGGGFASYAMLIGWVVIIGLFLYFTMIRPQKKEQNRIKTMLSELESGDSVLTSSGFYGVVIDVDEDTVIVEFGNNKNCRIPMQKTAITQIEKPGANS